MTLRRWLVPPAVSSFVLAGVWVATRGPAPRQDALPHTPPAALSAAPPAPPTPPPCTHEACAERPAALYCTAWHVDTAVVACARFEVQYEHHCACDAWGPP